MTGNFELRQQPIDPLEVETIAEQIEQTRFIAHLTADEIRQMIAEGTILFLYEGDYLAGFGAWIRINAVWVEAGPFFVSDSYRGMGLGKRLLADVTETNLKMDGKLIGMSINPRMKQMFLQNGYREVSLRELPLRLHIYLLSKLSIRKIFSFVRNINASDRVSYFIAE